MEEPSKTSIVVVYVWVQDNTEETEAIAVEQAAMELRHRI